MWNQRWALSLSPSHWTMNRTKGRNIYTQAWSPTKDDTLFPLLPDYCQKWDINQNYPAFSRNSASHESVKLIHVLHTENLINTCGMSEMLLLNKCSRERCGLHQKNGGLYKEMDNIKTPKRTKRSRLPQWADIKVISTSSVLSQTAAKLKTQSSPLSRFLPFQVVLITLIRVEVFSCLIILVIISCLVLLPSPAQDETGRWAGTRYCAGSGSKSHFCTVRGVEMYNSNSTLALFIQL